MKKNKKINAGIIGCGVIGTALIDWLKTNNPGCNLLLSDPPKNLNDNLENADIIFISIHIPTEIDGSQDLSVLKKIIKSCPDKPIFIRTTVLPGTCDKLSKELRKKVYFLPEFLSERSAMKDFEEQPMIYTGEIALLKEVFLNKPYIEMSSLEAEIAKYAHNAFGALKVTYFNGIYELTKKMNADYEKIRQGFLLSNYINQMHTSVPGPDGKFGYGGKCFNKDITAFCSFAEDIKIANLLKETINANKYYQSRDENA